MSGRVSLCGAWELLGLEAGRGSAGAVRRPEKGEDSIRPFAPGRVDGEVEVSRDARELEVVASRPLEPGELWIHHWRDWSP